MVRIFFLIGFAAAMAFTPAWLFDNKVLPELFKLKDLYSSASQWAADLGGDDFTAAGSRPAVDNH